MHRDDHYSYGSRFDSRWYFELLHLLQGPLVVAGNMAGAEGTAADTVVDKESDQTGIVEVVSGLSNIAAAVVPSGIALVAGKG